MAIRYATKSGDWSDVSVWDGGSTLPGASDDVHANTFTVNIDQSVTVNRLSVAAASPAAQGGGFTCSSDVTIDLQALEVGAHTGSRTAILTITGGTVTVNVATEITGDTTTSGSEPAAIEATSGVLTLNGDVLGGSVSGGNTVVVGGDSVVTINGTVTGGSNSAAYGAYMASASAQLAVIGEIVGGTLGPGVQCVGGSLRLDAMLVFESGRVSPLNTLPQVTPQFIRDGSHLGIKAPSDDNWPAPTGTPIVVQRYTTGNPAPEDVRAGVTYDSTGMSTGTLAVPPPESVAAGVPTDDTVGTAALSLADLAAVTGAQIAAATDG